MPVHAKLSWNVSDLVDLVSDLNVSDLVSNLVSEFERLGRLDYIISSRLLVRLAERDEFFACCDLRKVHTDRHKPPQNLNHLISSRLIPQTYEFVPRIGTFREIEFMKFFITWGRYGIVYFLPNHGAVA